MSAIAKLKAQLNEAGVDTSTLQSLADFLPLTTARLNANSSAINDLESTFVLKISSKEATELWHKLRELVPHTSYYPIITADYLYVEPDPYVPVQTTLEKASQIQGKQWLTEQWQSYLDKCRKYNYDPDGIRSEFDWYKPEVPLTFDLIFDVNASFWYSSFELNLLPTQNSWEAPAYLHYGGWNACPQTRYTCSSS